MPTYKQVNEVTGIGYEKVGSPGGYQAFYFDGKYHRNGAPAILYNSLYIGIKNNGTLQVAEEWYKHGIRHCTTGPAVTEVYGSAKYFVYGKQYSQENFNKVKNMPLSELPLHINDDSKSFRQLVMAFFKLIR